MKKLSKAVKAARAGLIPESDWTPEPTIGGHMKLTQEQKKAYMEGGANLCPFCKSADITGGSIDIDGREAWQEVSCNECNEQWRDVYKLAFVEDSE